MVEWKIGSEFFVVPTGEWARNEDNEGFPVIVITGSNKNDWREVGMTQFHTTVYNIHRSTLAVGYLRYRKCYASLTLYAPALNPISTNYLQLCLVSSDDNFKIHDTEIDSLSKPIYNILNKYDVYSMTCNY